MAMVTFGKQAPMMPKTPRMGVQGGLRKYPAQVVPFGGAPMSNEAARVAPPGFTPATVHGAYGDTSVPNTGHEYHPATPPVGHFNVPIGGVQGGTMQPPGPGYGQPVPRPPMPMPTGPGQYAPPSVPPTQMIPTPAGHPPVGPVAPVPMPMRPPVPGEYVSTSGINLAPHPLVGNSPQFNSAIDLLRGQQSARQDLLDRNVRAYDGMGRPPGYVSPSAPGVAGMIAGHQHQQMLNGLSPSDAKQLQLGGAKPEESFTMPPSPKLDPSSRFARAQSSDTTGTGSTYIPTPSGGAQLIGANALKALNAAGFKTADLNPSSPYANQAQNAMRKIQQDSESRLAAERSSAGGGVSKAAQYARAQSDQKILNRARRAGVGLESPAVSAAVARETGRQEELRNNIAGLGGGSGNGTGLGKQVAAANKFANSDVGKQFADAYQGEGRPHYDKGSSGILNHLNKKIDTMDRGELEGLSAWVENHPELSRESSPHANEVRAKIAAKLNRGKSKTATARVAPPAPSAPVPPMTVNGTNVGNIPDQF